MRRDSKLLDTYSDPKFVIQVGNYHGVVLIEYTPDKKYVTDIDLVLSGEDESFIYFFARMRFGESYTTVNSTFSYCDDKTIEVKKNLRAIPFYEVSEKLSSFMPINPEVFIDLVKDTLKEVYAIKDEFMFYQVSDKEIEKYYNQNVEKEELILYDVIKKYFYVCKSIFECLAQKSEKLIIDDYDFHEFPQILLSCFWIRELELYELLISEIPEALTNLHNLRSLSLKLKFLTKLPSSLHRLANLEVLKLERTSISELPDKLFELGNLRELYIINNNGIKNFPDQISKLKNLEYLYAYSNEIKELSNSMFRLENLKVLNIAHNKIEEIPREITALTNLRVLNLKGNRLKKIPDDLFDMISLEEVDLSNNPSLNTDEIYNLLMKSGRSDKINLIM